jgi:hypothetical protein
VEVDTTASRRRQPVEHGSDLHARGHGGGESTFREHRKQIHQSPAASCAWGFKISATDEFKRPRRRRGASDTTRARVVGFARVKKPSGTCSGRLLHRSKLQGHRAKGSAVVAAAATAPARQLYASGGGEGTIFGTLAFGQKRAPEIECRRKSVVTDCRVCHLGHDATPTVCSDSTPPAGLDVRAAERPSFGLRITDWVYRESKAVGVLAVLSAPRPNSHSQTQSYGTLAIPKTEVTTVNPDVALCPITRDIRLCWWVAAHSEWHPSKSMKPRL